MVPSSLRLRRPVHIDSTGLRCLTLGSSAATSRMASIFLNLSRSSIFGSSHSGPAISRSVYVSGDDFTLAAAVMDMSSEASGREKSSPSYFGSKMSPRCASSDVRPGSRLVPWKRGSRAATGVPEAAAAKAAAA